MKFGVGQSVPRKEDPRLITGGGQFTDDLHFEGQLYLRVLRSPYAHGQVVALDTSAAMEADGVIAVYTAEDLSELGGLPCRAVLKDAEGNPAFIPRRPVLAEAKVCFAGQAVAAVVARTPQQAKDVFPTVDDLPNDVDLYALLAADGTPIVLADDKGTAISHAMGDELEIAHLH